VSIKRVNYVSLPVRDLEAATAFYSSVLGLKVSLLAKRWVELDAGNVTLALYPTEPGEEARSGEVAFEVERLDAFCEALRAKGVELPHGIEEFSLPTSRGRLARFEDPSGNKLELVEPVR
jgi:uncharacterized protein